MPRMKTQKPCPVSYTHLDVYKRQALVCVDDEAIRSLLPSIARPITTYGFADDAQVQAVNVRAVGTQMHFTARRRNGITLPDLDVVLNLPGRHNVLLSLIHI